MASGQSSWGQASGLDEYAAWGHTWRLAAFWELGRRSQIEAELAAFARVVGRLREPFWTWRLTMMQATLALFEGRFGHASELADEALEIGLCGGHQAAEFPVFDSFITPTIDRSFMS